MTGRQRWHPQPPGDTQGCPARQGHRGVAKSLPSLRVPGITRCWSTHCVCAACWLHVQRVCSACGMHHGTCMLSACLLHVAMHDARLESAPFVLLHALHAQCTLSACSLQPGTVRALGLRLAEQERASVCSPCVHPARHAQEHTHTCVRAKQEAGGTLHACAASTCVHIHMQVQPFQVCCCGAMRLLKGWLSHACTRAHASVHTHT